jgi:endo-1,4-beta-xylanase
MRKTFKISTLIVLVTVNFIQAQKGLKDYYADYFPMGVAVNPKQFDVAIEANLIKSQFNSITPENVMKMGPIHPKEDTYNWVEADKVIAFAQANNMKVRGHALCWHNQVPDWLFVDNAGNQVTKEVLLARMKKHITDVVSRYKGKIYAWDVVNEAVPDTTDAIYRASKFYKIIGPEFIEKAFEYAHEADPNALLFYNDYDTEKKIKRDKIITLLKGLIAKGVPVNGVGMQGHWSIYEPTAQELEESITQFAALGLKVQVTELDVSVHQKINEPVKEKYTGKNIFTPEMENLQIEKYKILFEVLRKHKDLISGITFWNLSDNNTWLDRFPVTGRKDYPLLFDTKSKPKKAYKAVTAF